MGFKIFKGLTQPGTLIFFALIALLISLGLQLAVATGVLSIAVLSAAAPVLLGIFLTLVVAATVAAVGWGIRYFYKDYQKEKELDEKIKKILRELPDVSKDGNKKSGDEFAEDFEEEVKTSPKILEIDPVILEKLKKKLKRDYGVASFGELSPKRAEILGTEFSYRKAFFNACKAWCVANEKAIIIAGALLVALLIMLIVFSSLSLAGAPVPFFIGAVLNGMVGFFEAGFVGLGWTAPSAFAAHHLVASILAGITFCLGPVNIISTFRRLGGVLYDIGLWIRKPIEKSLAVNTNNTEDIPLSERTLVKGNKDSEKDEDSEKKGENKSSNVLTKNKPELVYSQNTSDSMINLKT